MKVIIEVVLFYVIIFSRRKRSKSYAILQLYILVLVGQRDAYYKVSPA